MYWVIFPGNPDAELPDIPPISRFAAMASRWISRMNTIVAACPGRWASWNGLSTNVSTVRNYLLAVKATGNHRVSIGSLTTSLRAIFSKLRVTNWPECPDYEVLRGPLSLTVPAVGFSVLHGSSALQSGTAECLRRIPLLCGHTLVREGWLDAGDQGYRDHVPAR